MAGLVKIANGGPRNKAKMAKKEKPENGLKNSVQLAPRDPDDPSVVQVIIETPKGSCNKYAFDHQQRTSLRQRLSAGVAHDFAPHEARLIGGEQHIGRRKFGGLTRTTHRNVGAELHQVLRRLAAAWLQRRPDWVGGDSVDANALARKLLGQAFHEDSDGSPWSLRSREYPAKDRRH
jgi:hypothetical protein